MAFDKTNTGNLGRNPRKDKPTHPDYSGQCDINGQQYWISAWLKESGPNSRNPGEKFFSLSFKPKDASQGQSRPAPARNDGDPLVPSPRPQPTERQLANQDGGGAADIGDVPFARMEGPCV